jgi:hypothetical protein
MLRCLRVIVGLALVFSLLGSACTRVERSGPIPASPRAGSPTVNAAQRGAAAVYAVSRHAVNWQLFDTLACRTELRC